MTDNRRLLSCLLCLLLLAVVAGVTGCAALRPQPVRAPLSPPATEPTLLADLSVEPPLVQPNLYLHKAPLLLSELPSPPQPGRLQFLLRQAEMRFQGGKLHYQAGEWAAARREFDRAIDILLAAPEGVPDRRSLERKLAELVEAIHRFDVSGLGAGEVAEEPGFDKSPLEDIPELTFPIDPKQRNKVTEELRATVSQLPLEVNDEVLRYIQYFSSARGRKTLVGGLRRAGKYRPLIQRILDEEGVPQELIHLAQAESGFLPRAVSRKRATGMWQFMLLRGREYGLLRTRSTDDRLDPEKATRAAARHLRDLYTKFGDWYLAMAAYNSGPSVVEKAVQRTGYADFWELRRRNVFPRETANYIPIILAMTIMAKNPGDYGLDGIEPDPPLEYSTVDLEAPTHMALIADILECSVSEIRELNPALLRNVAPKGYLLRVPKGKVAAVVSALEMIPPSQRDAWRFHRVTEGETLTAIARRYRATAKGISELNHLNGDGPEAGHLLVIPAPAQSSRAFSSRTTTTSTARRRTTSKKASPSSKAKSSSKAPTGKSGTVASRNTAGRTGSAGAAGR